MVQAGTARRSAGRAVLVTGGAGYVGSHVCKALAARGFLPVTYDDLSRGNRWAVRWGPLEIGSIEDKPRLAAVMAAWQPLAVLHFAALAYVGESVARPLPYWRTNVAGSLCVLECMAEAQIPCLVFSSSCATYGIPATPLIAESHRQAPINPYGASKLAVERMIADATPAIGLSSALLRYFNAAGADPEGEIGEAHEPETHLIPLALRAVRNADAPLPILGDDWPTRDGTCERDFVHVSDIADAHVLALERLLAGSGSLALNLGIGHGFTVREVIAAVERVAGERVPTSMAPRRPGDPPSLVADPALARQLLGWAPRFPDLATMIAHAFAWEQRRTHGAAALTLPGQPDGEAGAA